MTSSVLRIDGIALVGRGSARNVGALKTTAAGMTWEGAGSKIKETIAGNTIQGAHWFPIARGTEDRYLLHISVKDGRDMRLSGFQDKDRDAVNAHLSKISEILPRTDERSVSGFNFGTIGIDGTELGFSVQKQPAFSVDLATVSACNATGNEVALEFHVQDAAGPQEQALFEMRFQVPDTAEAAVLKDNVNAKAAIELGDQSVIAVFESVSFVTPRGRFTIELCSTFLRLRGSGDKRFKIMYNSVTKLFMLPTPDGREVAFVIGLDPPIRQGRTAYPYLVAMFQRDVHAEMELNLSDDDLKKYGDRLSRTMENTLDALFANICKALMMGKKIIGPGHSFKSSLTAGGRGGADSVNCTYKANEGQLFPLERSFFFIHKPPIHIPFEDVRQLEFMRIHDVGGVSSRTFDLYVSTRTEQLYQFTGIGREELTIMQAFARAKNIAIAGTAPQKPTKRVREDEGMEDLEDDLYLRRVQDEGADEEESEDEDFDPDAEKMVEEEDEYEEGEGMDE